MLCRLATTRLGTRARLFRPLSVLASEVRGLQAPLKQQYSEHPASAVVQMKAEGLLCPDTLSVVVLQGPGQAVTDPNSSADSLVTVSGLHPAAGGDGTEACSGDMLLQSLVACAGVTFRAVWNAFGLGPIARGRIIATGEMDFAGTLGVVKGAPVGLTRVHLDFEIESDEDAAAVEKAVATAERYCVIYQTLKSGVPELSSSTMK